MIINPQNNTSHDIIEVKPSKIIKSWGWEEIIINSKENNLCAKILHYNDKGSLSSFHSHPSKKEYFKCTSGSFIFRYKNNKGITEETLMTAGDCVYIPNCAPHQLESLEPNSEILEISTYHSDDDVIRIEPGDSQK